MYLVLSQAQFMDSISRGLYFRKGNKARIKILYIIKLYCSVHVTAVIHALTNMAMGAEKEGKNISNTEESRKNL